MSARPIFLPGNRYLIAFLTFLSAFAPLSTDMYLPALPVMAETLETGNELVSLTISLFLLIFAISMIIWGTLADKYGRKPILYTGSVIYILASAGIALASSIQTILFLRCVQAAGSGAVSALSLAIVKDILRGGLMEKVVSIMQAATILAPITAPVIGGWLLLITSWRGIFWCLAFFGAVALAGAFWLRETRPKTASISLMATFARIGSVLREKSFRDPLLIFSLMAMPFMSYLSVSAFIFQDEFGLSAQAYSLFFAFNAGISLLGPLAHMRFFRHMPRNPLISTHMALMCAAAILIIFFGKLGPWWFAAIFAFISFCGSSMRPPSTILMLQVIDRDNGIVASLISCGGLLFGALAMILASLSFWPNPIMAVGFIGSVVSLICLLAWLKIKQEK